MGGREGQVGGARLGVGEEGEQGDEGLLVRAAGQAHVGRHQVVHDTPQVALETLPSVLNKTLTFVPQTFLRRKFKRIDNWILLPEGAVELVELTVALEHVPLRVADADVHLQHRHY